MFRILITLVFTNKSYSKLRKYSFYLFFVLITRPTTTTFIGNASNATSQIALNVTPPTPVTEKDRPPFTSEESQDFEIISDSELASSLEEGGPEEYLVVDGFIDQTMESFTPKTKQKEHHFPSPDVLYHLRLLSLIHSHVELYTSQFTLV